MAEKTDKPRKTVKVSFEHFGGLGGGFWYSALCLEALARALLALKKDIDF